MNNISNKEWQNRLVCITDETEEWKKEGRSYFYCVDDEATGELTCGLGGRKKSIIDMIYYSMCKSEAFEECVREAVKKKVLAERRINELS